MKPCESFRDSIEGPLVVGTAACVQAPACFTLPVDSEWLNHEFLKKFRLPILIGAGLLISGLVHLILLCASGADWSGPLSLRKPALFGISAGMTVWSITWILTQLAPRPGEQRLASLLSVGLLLEVGLITLQHWRGVSSHFNRTTLLNAFIETIMLGLILLVTAGIGWLCFRSRWLRPMAESQAIAIRAGLWLLLVSCGLGILVTIAGEINLARGRPPETWGLAGVLKYPHGAVLHAVQTLPFLSFLMQKFRVRFSIGLMRSAVAAHLLFLGHALWQTFLGRARMDVDATSGILLAASVLLLVLPITAICVAVIARVRRRVENL